ADRVDPGRLLVGVNPDKAVKIGKPGPVVIGVAFAPDGLAGFVGDELERAGAGDVLLVPVRILVESGLAVDPRIRIGKRWQEGIGREFQPEYDRRRVRRLDLVDHRKIALTRAGDAFRREDDLVPARHYIRRRQQRPV